MNKLFVVSIMVLGLLVISGCGIEPGKSLAGQVRKVRQRSRSF